MPDCKTTEYCSSNCPFPDSFVRNRYFYGKLLTVSDFEMEQQYIIEKYKALNRLIHGVGVVCGLNVNAAISGDSGDTLSVTIDPGMALDCCGNLIYVNRQETIEKKPINNNEPYYIYVKYKECYEFPQPAPVDNCSCKEECCYGHIADSFEISISTAVPQSQKVKVKIKGFENINNIEDLEKYILKNIKGSWTECTECNEFRVLIGVVSINNQGEAEINEEKLTEYRSVVYNNPLLRDLLLSLNKSFKEHQAAKNPHKIKHSDTDPVMADPTSDDKSGFKHITNSDAKRWESSIRGIKVGDAVLSGTDAHIKLEAGQNVRLESKNQDTVIINATGGTTAKCGTIAIKIDNENVVISPFIDPGLGIDYSVQLGIVHPDVYHETKRKVIEYSSYITDGERGAILSSIVFTNGKFIIKIQRKDAGFPHVDENYVNIRWVAIPAEKQGIIKIPIEDIIGRIRDDFINKGIKVVGDLVKPDFIDKAENLKIGETVAEKLKNYGEEVVKTQPDLTISEMFSRISQKLGAVNIQYVEDLEDLTEDSYSKIKDSIGLEKGELGSLLNSFRK